MTASAIEPALLRKYGIQTESDVKDIVARLEKALQRDKANL